MTHPSYYDRAGGTVLWHWSIEMHRGTDVLVFIEAFATVEGVFQMSRRHVGIQKHRVIVTWWSNQDWARQVFVANCLKGGVIEHHCIRITSVTRKTDARRIHSCRAAASTSPSLFRSRL